jgi:chaperonin GroES
MAKKAAKASGDVKLAPLGDRIVLKRAVAETKTAGGIVLPDSATDKPQRGEIVAVGEGHVKNNGTRVSLTVQPGDQVIFSSYAGDEFKVGDETYVLMRESDVLAVIA